MSSPMNDGDAAVSAWLQDGPELGPVEGLEAILSETRAVRQRPARTFPSHWLPMSLDRGPGALRRPTPLLVVLVLAALIAAVVLAIAVGSQRRLPPPFGFAANGAIAYDTGNGGHAFLADADGRNPRRLPGQGIERRPTFSPDGMRIVYFSRPFDFPGTSADPLGSEFQIFLANPDGSNAHPILGGAKFRLDPFVPPSWSPDSRSIAFRADAGGSDEIWVVEVDGVAPPAAITSGTATPSAPAWSPDGKWIAYVEWRPGTPGVNALMVARPDGSGRVLLHAQDSLGPDEGAFGETLRWSPDSTRIAYARGRDPATGEPEYWAYLAVASLDGTETVVWPEPSGWLHFPTWSLDGRRLYFVTGETVNVIRAHDLTTSADAVVDVCGAAIPGPLQLSPNGELLVEACPGAPILGAVSSAGPAPLALPTDAVRIDIQRLAP